MDCKEDNGFCSRCGIAIRFGVKRNCFPNYRFPFGDYVHFFLKVAGITENKISAATGKQCGCKKRREKLNSLFGVKRAKDTT